MPLLHDIQDALGARRVARARRRARLEPARRARRARAAKALGVAAALVVLLAVALAVGDGDYHATAIGWVPFLSAVAALAVARVYLALLVRTLRFSDAAAARECDRDADVRFTVDFENTGPLWFFRIRAFLFTSDMFGNVASERAVTLALGPRQSQQVGFSTRFAHVGTYAAGVERVEVSDFLGLFTATLPNRTRRNVAVTPLLVPIASLHFSNEAVVETTRASRSVLADSMDYAYVREYEQGDPLRAIHWKLSARADQYMTRLYEVQTNPGVVVVLDFYGRSDDAEVLMGMFDAVVEAGFSVAEFARERGLDVEVLFRDKSGRQRRVATWSRDARARIIADMPQMSNDAAEEAESVALVQQESTSPRGQGNIIVCSAGMDPTMISTLAEAKMRRRAPMMFAVVPRGVVERERDAYCKPLARLDDADVPYVVLADARELAGVSA